jgi:hypothetical protein
VAAFVVTLLICAYLGSIVAVAIHEFIGHGVTSVLLGGQFKGVALDFGGMGWADAYAASEGTTRQILVLIGGAISTIAAGLALAWLTWRTRLLPAIAGPLGVLAAGLLLEGGPYMLVNSIHPVPPGDFGRVIASEPWLRWPFIIAGALIAIPTIFATVSFFSWLLDCVVSGGRGVSPRARIGLGFLVALLACGLECAFDWNQLAPGVGIWPNVGFCAGWLASALITLRWALPPRPLNTSARSMWISLATTTGALAAMSVAIGLWLRHGVQW